MVREGESAAEGGPKVFSELVAQFAALRPEDTRVAAASLQLRLGSFLECAPWENVEQLS